MTVARAERFVKLPIERALVWEGLPWFQRALGADMFRVFQEREHSVAANWEVAVCSALGVPGRERGNVVRALQGLVEAGVLLVQGGLLQLLYSERAYRSARRPHDVRDTSASDVHSTSTDTPPDVRSTSTRRPLDVHSTSTDTPPDIHQDLNPRNHSIPSGEIDREIDRKREREARAHAGGPSAGEDQTETESLVRREFARRFEAAEGSLWTRAGDPGIATLATWLCSLPGDPSANLARTLDAFFADAWCRSKHFPVGHLARDVHKYFEPREAPSLAKTSPQQQLRELNERQKALMAARDFGAEYEQLAVQIRALQAEVDGQSSSGQQRRGGEPTRAFQR